MPTLLDKAFRLRYKLDVKKKHLVKVALPIYDLSLVRRWLLDNCKRRWTASDYKGGEINWRSLAKIRNKKDLWFDHSDNLKVTLIVTFNQVEDLMLFLLVWPGEIIVNE